MALGQLDENKRRELERRKAQGSPPEGGRRLEPRGPDSSHKEDGRDHSKSEEGAHLHPTVPGEG